MADKLLDGYESAGARSENALRWSQWWLDHRERVRKIGLGLFIAADVLLVGYGFWGFIDWLALGGVKEEVMIRQMTSPDYGRYEGLSLEEVQVGAPIVLPGGSGKLDLLAPVENHNANFWAELDYHFVVGGTAQPLLHAFILPGQAKYLVQLGAPSDAGGSVELKIEKRVWHRADLRGETSEVFAATRLNLYATNPVFTPSDPLATTPSSSAQFTLANDTAFGYYDVDLLVLLYRGDAIVGANQLTVDSLAAGERKPLQLFWYQTLPQVTKVEVVPSVNAFDPAVYQAPR